MTGRKKGERRRGKKVGRGIAEEGKGGREDRKKWKRGREEIDGEEGKGS